MKNVREIVVAMALSKPELTIDAVCPDGDVAFHINLKDCDLNKDDCSSPVMRTRFLVNFLGELFVRENIDKFATILTGLDPALYQKMVCTCRHTDFGMEVDFKITMLTFRMHISLVQEILTEEFGRIPGKSVIPPGNAFDDFDASKPKGKDDKPDNSRNDNESDQEEEC